MKLKKLNAGGFTHGILLMAFVVVFSVAGVAYIVASHANPAPVASSGGAGLKPAVNPNPDNCNTKTYKTIALPTGNNRGLLNDYFSNKTAAGKVVKDHFYTLKRADAALAKTGYCYQSSEGFAYITKVSGTVPLYQFWNGTHHLYSTGTTVPAGYKKGAIVAYVSPKLTGFSEFGHSAVLEAEYQFVNAGTDGTGQHFFYTVNGGMDVTNVAALQKLGYVEYPTTPVFYVWRDTNVVPDKKTTPPASPKPAPTKEKED